MILCSSGKNNWIDPNLLKVLSGDLSIDFCYFLVFADNWLVGQLMDSADSSFLIILIIN